MFYFKYLSLVPVIVATMVAIVRFHRLPAALRCVAGLVFFSDFVEIVSRVLGARQQSNLFLLPIDTLAEFGLLAWMYRLALRPSAVSRLLPAVVAVFALASLFSYANPASLYEFNSVQRFAESLLIIGLVLLYFYKVIRELVIVHLEREPLFWVSVGLLLYFSGNVFIFVSSNYVLQHSKSLSLRLWNIHELLYMVLYGLYAWALWMKPSTQRL
jgi:hypothetical protein